MQDANNDEGRRTNDVRLLVHPSHPVDRMSPSVSEIRSLCTKSRPIGWRESGLSRRAGEERGAACVNCKTRRFVTRGEWELARRVTDAAVASATPRV